jgi:extracellular factor (EF) 3-hydroxypalmitic acid methyl ester biosynthesis protein
MAVTERFDLVVAGGLFDYLPDRWAVTTLRAIRRMMAPGGRLLFSNIAAGNPFRPWLEYLAEWRLIERHETDLRRLLREAGFTSDHVDVCPDTSRLALMVDVRVGRDD